MRTTLLMSMLACATPVAASAACVASGASERPHLVELYTSEGCSSCPPAEHWLSALRGKPGWAGLEYHVDYWDTKDWHDPWADARFAKRQKQLAQQDRRAIVYTPQVAVDGRLWKDFPKGAPPQPIEADAPALKLSVTRAAAMLKANVETAPGNGSARVFVALTEDGLSNAVDGGENRGKTLHHDHVVRAFAGPLPLGTHDVDLEPPKSLDVANAKVVAFMQDERDGSVLQVVPLALGACAL
jgi:hypothetical protein